MEIIITISNCLDCPAHKVKDTEYDIDEDYFFGILVCNHQNVNNQEIGIINSNNKDISIPEWCPLTAKWNEKESIKIIK